MDPERSSTRARSTGARAWVAAGPAGYVQVALAQAGGADQAAVGVKTQGQPRLGWGSGGGRGDGGPAGIVADMVGSFFLVMV